MDRKDFEALLNNYPDCVSDGKKLKAFLKDLYPDVPKAIVNTLTIMADDGIISEMQMSIASSSLVSARLQKKLEDDYGLSQNIISKCFSLISNNAKQTESTISAYTHEKITGFIDAQPKIALRKEGSQKHDILQPKYNPKDFEIENGTLKKYKGSSSVVVIPDNVTSIGKRAFDGCRNLTSITIPDSVTSIGDQAFDGCTGLTNITIPNSVTDIGEWTFYGCTGLTSVRIPDTVTSIGSNAFIGTAWYNNKPDGLVYAGKVVYKYKGTLAENSSITLREDTLGIASCAFKDCSGLKNITIPDRVTRIGDYAFTGCRGLTAITIPDSVTSIGWYAFTGCRGLTTITIPDSVMSIGWYAFTGCHRLTAITIPDSVTSISPCSFFNCFGLTSITIPDSVTSIGSGAFAGCTRMTSVTIPDSVTSIGNSTFESCVSLASIIIPDSVTSIGEEAFKMCNRLKIYCEAESEPSGWNSGWNPDNRPVVWGVKK